MLPWEAGAISRRIGTPSGGAAAQLSPGSLGPFKSPWESVFLTANRCSMPLEAMGWDPLHHGIEGTAALAATPWQCLCGWGDPTLGGVRGHKQGTATVG